MLAILSPDAKLPSYLSLYRTMLPELIGNFLTNGLHFFFAINVQKEDPVAKLIGQVPRGVAREPYNYFTAEPDQADKRADDP